MVIQKLYTESSTVFFAIIYHKIYFQALRTAELLAGDDKEMNEVVTELKQLMGLTGDNVTQELRTLLSDNKSALSRTMGEKLRTSINKEDLKDGGN